MLLHVLCFYQHHLITLGIFFRKRPLEDATHHGSQLAPDVHTHVTAMANLDKTVCILRIGEAIDM